MDNSDFIRTHMEDLAKKASQSGCCHSKFLTPAEVELVRKHFQNRVDVDLLLDGGFENAERRVAVFVQPEWGQYQRDKALAALQLQYRVQDTLRHQDVLGAVLGLGVARDVVGDIQLEPGRTLLVCAASMAEYLAQQLQKAGRVGLKVKKITLEELPSAAVQLQEKDLTVASLRLDALLAAAFALSRTEAVQAVEGGKVQLAHVECTSPARTVKIEEVITLRGKGRFKLLSAQGVTRKGRQKIVVGFYI